MTSQQIISVGLPLVIMAFVVYRRARAHIGRQKMKPTRMTVRMGILTLLGIGFLVAMPLHSAVYAVIGVVDAHHDIRRNGDECQHIECSFAHLLIKEDIYAFTKWLMKNEYKTMF